MCGRYLLKEIDEVDRVVRRIFGFGLNLERPRFNIAPSQVLPIVANDQEGHPRPADMRWGFVPFWDKAPKPSMAPINARAEDVMAKPMFRQAVQRRRCLVPADGFYEWRRLSEKEKLPYVIRRCGGRSFFFAGIHEAATSDRPETFTLLTTGPNELMREIHDRMPVLLDEESGPEWLRPGEVTAEDLARFSQPYSAREMEAWPVTRLVNSPRNDVPEVMIREDQLF